MLIWPHGTAGSARIVGRGVECFFFFVANVSIFFSIFNLVKFVLNSFICPPQRFSCVLLGHKLDSTISLFPQVLACEKSRHFQNNKKGNFVKF